MSIKIKDLVKRNIPKDSSDLAELSDQIWELGTLSEIKEKVSPDLFTIHIAINMIGNWQSDGWYGIIRNNFNLIPYIPQTLDKLGLLEIKEAFQNVISLFPKFTVFDDSKLYCDIISFLSNVRLKVNDERLNQYSITERSQISEAYHRKMEILDNLSESLWTDHTNKEGWAAALEYIQLHIEET